MKSILLVGAGQLGSRHLQALALLESPFKIYVCDPLSESLDIAKARYQEVDAKAEHRVSYVSSLKEVDETAIDFVIIATSSAVRFNVYQVVVAAFRVKNVIFEKVLFQELEHYQVVSKDLKDKGINAWVNCPFRMYPFYQHVKIKFLQEDHPISFTYRGGEWVGLGCNTIHYVDALSFLSGERLMAVSTDELDKSIMASKRSGYIEFTGTLKCNFGAGSSLEITSVRASDQGSELVIKQGEYAIIMDEHSGGYRVFEGNEPIESGTLPMPYQSNLTNKVIQDIVDTQSCHLSFFDDSVSLHIPIIEALLRFQNTLLGVDEVKLKIT